MYKLLIVDDEPSARYGLRDYFQWSQYGIEVAGEADDGESALDLVSQIKPHIVLTDVKMPYMDGIQLSLKIREQHPEIKIIFISGHDDVEYLKSALKVDAIDYIFKPVNFKELGTVVERVVAILQSEEKQKSLIYDMNVKLMQSMPLLREKFFMTLIRDGIGKNPQVQKEIEFLDLNLSMEGLFCVFVISVDDKDTVFESMPEKDKQLTSFAVLNVCQELMSLHVGGYAFENRRGEYVGLLTLASEEDEEKLFILASEIKDNLLNYLNISVTIGVGKTVKELEKVPQSYLMAYSAANQKLFLGKNRVISMDSLENGPEVTYRFDALDEEKLTSLLKAADEEKALTFIDEIFEGLVSNRNINIKYCQNVCLQLLVHASRLMMELEINPEGLNSNESALWEKLFKLETVHDMKFLIGTHFKQVCTSISEKRNKKSRNVISQIKEVIGKRYNENITVNDIASAVYLTSTYVCLIFKQETGETVNDYITKVRMEKAKELLKDSRNKFYDICYAVGYSDPSYFSKQFKKYTGLSPSEYREKLV